MNVNDGSSDEPLLWYHTIDLPDGSTTPGWFDLRPVLERIPWPDVAGKRCLDVGTWDGFLAFELERRGAREVVATDVSSHELWDWLPREREDGPAYHAAVVGPKGRGFEVAKQRLGSQVTREWINVYDLSPETVGTFDVVVCGSLLLHLREPFRALEALRSVTGTTFLSLETIDDRTSLLLPHRPVMALDGNSGRWASPNAAGHRRMLEIAGFTVRRSERLAEPYGRAHPHVSATHGVRDRVRSRVRKQWLGHDGVPTSAVLADVDIRPPALAREG